MWHILTNRDKCHCVTYNIAIYVVYEFKWLFKVDGERSLTPFGSLVINSNNKIEDLGAWFLLVRNNDLNYCSYEFRDWSARLSSIRIATLWCFEAMNLNLA